MQFQQAADEFLTHLQVEQNCSPHTIRAYVYDLECFGLFLKQYARSTDLNQLLNSTIRRFIQDQVLNHQVKPRTLQRRISCYKSLSAFCLKEKWLDVDFMAGIQFPKADKKLPVYMKLDELQRLFKFLETDLCKFQVRNELMFKLLVTTGMRRQELVDLNWEQLDFNNHTVLVKGKGRKERLLPIHPIVLPLFVTYRELFLEHQLHSSQPVFLNCHGERLNPRGLHRIFKEVLQAAGLPPHRFTLHHLRHTFATIMLQNTAQKIDLRTLQELFGHASLAMVAVYTHVDFEKKKQAVEALNI